jgi:hypothetical protein
VPRNNFFAFPENISSGAPCAKTSSAPNDLIHGVLVLHFHVYARTGFGIPDSYPDGHYKKSRFYD